jgi:hypothetical protein
MTTRGRLAVIPERLNTYQAPGIKSVLDVLKLQEQLVGVPIGPAAELAPVVGEDRTHLHAVLLEEGQRLVVQDMHRGHRQLARVEPGPDVAAVAVQHRLDVDLADALQGAGVERIHGHELTGGVDLDVPFPKLGVVAFERLDLFVGQLELLLPGRLFQP